MADLRAITFDVEGHVATITLDRPESFNSFNNEMAEDLTWAWQTVRDTDDIHVAVVQANGDKAFCTGVDVKQGQEERYWFMPENLWNQFDPGLTLAPKLHHRVWKPVIVAVHGLCAGGGQYFLNEADIVICSDDATFFDPHANVGIVSALEPIGMVHRGVPLGDVLRWALMGNEERLSAATALRLGLVTEVVSREELRPRAREIAESIAARNPKAVQGTVRAIWEALDMSRSAALHNGINFPNLGNFPAWAPATPPAKRPPQIR